MESGPSLQLQSSQTASTSSRKLSEPPIVLSISSVSPVHADLRTPGRRGPPIGTEDMANMEVTNTKTLIVGGSSEMGVALARPRLGATMPAPGKCVVEQVPIDASD